jgi:putative aminopeptidase FrvX
MKEWIRALSEAIAPTGGEGQVRALLKEAAQSVADEMQEDVLGNLIVRKKGTGASPKTLLLVAHMDEPGLMVSHVGEDGFARVVPIGGTADVAAAYWVGRQVAFPNGARAVVGAGDAKGTGDVRYEALYLDFGLTSRAAVEERVQVGDFCSLAQPLLELAEGRLVGKALASRVPCAAALEVLKRLNGQPHDVVVVFSAQQGVGNRGLKTAAFGVEPDFGLVLDVVSTGDAPGGPASEVELGKGVAVKILDRLFIVPPHIKNLLIDIAEELGIAHQLEVNSAHGSEARQVLTTGSGVPTGALSIPVREAMIGADMVDLRDVEAAVRLATAVLERYDLR